MAKNDALYAARMQRHWTQSTLAAQLNTTRVTIVRWEQGKTLPSLYFREQLCQLFGKTAQELGLDQSPSEAKPQQVWLVPEMRNRFFTGRETTLQQLHAALSVEDERDVSGIHMLSGLAGLGKTQIALEYAYRFRQYYAVIAWVRAETHDTLLADLHQLAIALHMPGAYELTETHMVPALSAWLSTHDDWLLICDNVEDLTLVSSIFPIHHLTGKILITTRIQAAGRFHPLHLQAMSNEEGVLLLLRRAKLLPIHSDLAQVAAEERAVATQLCQEFGGLPLAIEQAGAYIEETGCSVAGYLERFKCRSTSLLSWRGQQSGYPRSVTETLCMARDRVERHSLVAGELLSLCLFLHPDALPENVITHGAMHLGPVIQAATTDLLSLDEAFAILNASSLLRRDPETHLLTMHCLTQMVLRDQLGAEMQLLWVERALQALQQLFPASLHSEKAVWPLCELLLPHITCCLAHMERLTWGKQQVHLAQIGLTLLLKVADYLLERTRHAEVEALLTRALALFKQIGDSAYLDLALELQALAALYERLGRYNEVEMLVQQLLVSQQKILEPHDYQTAETLTIQALHGLAKLYGQQQMYIQAS